MGDYKEIMSNKYEDQLGTQQLLPLILHMALPSVIAQLVNLLYNLVDRIYIGHIASIGTNALAGIGVTNSIIVLISAFSQIVGGGGAPLASIALGKGDHKRAEKILSNGFVLLLIFSFCTASITYLFMNPILRMIGASDQTLGYAISYLRIYLMGTLFVQLSIGLNTFISCQGRPKIAMFSVLIGAIFNIILDPIFIFMLHLGVAGAAIATVISQFLSALWILAFLFSSKASLRIRLSELRPAPTIIMSILSLGISPFVMVSTESLIGFVLNGTLVRYGDIYVSALTIMQSALQIVSVPLGGFTQGVVPVISYNFGHSNKQRVIDGFKIMLGFTFSINLFLILLMILFPTIIGSLFTSDPQLLTVIRKYMPLFLAGMSIFGLQRSCQNMFVSLGEAKISLFIALLRKVILLIPLAILLSNIFQVRGVYMAEAIADAMAATICTVIFLIRFPHILKHI